MSIDEDKIIDAITGAIAMGIIGFLVLKGLLPPDEGIKDIFMIIGFILGRQGVGLAYSSFRANKAKK